MTAEKKLLVADASHFDRATISSALKNTYEILEVNNGISALGLVLEDPSKIRLGIIDISLPRMNGYEVLQKIKLIPKTKDIPIVLVGTESVKNNVVRGFQLGAIDFIAKPFEQDFFRERILSILKGSSLSYNSKLFDLVNNTEMYFNEVKQYDNVLNKTFKSLLMFRRFESPRHLRRVSLFSGIILKKFLENFPSEIYLNSEQMEIFTRATAYHDIGKISIPDNILQNHDSLTPKEQKIYNQHTIKGEELLQLHINPKLKDYIALCSDIASYHHECWDGSGYPRGIKGDDIPLPAQIVGLATSIDHFTRHFQGNNHGFFELAMEGILLDKEQYNPALLKALSASELVVNQIALKYADLPNK
ncbi:MAG: HD-GYP domain-containing protein [Aminipila sp.]